MTKNKRNLIIDIDSGNTFEDDFALCYAFAEPSFDIKAITLSPYKSKNINLKDAQIENTLEVHRIFRYLGFKNYQLCYEGSQGFCDNLYFEKTPAVEKIIEIAKKQKITIACFGALTNVAIAISNKPQIAKNIEIVWIGLRHVFHQEFNDLNYSLDKKAFEIVAKSTAKLTVIPSYIGKLFTMSYEKMNDDICINKLGYYLYERLKSEANHKSEFCKLYSLNVIGYLINKDNYYVKGLPINSLLKDFPNTSFNKLVNYVYDLKSTEVIWKDYVKKLEKLSNNFMPTNYYFISDTHFNDPRKYKIKQFGYTTREEMLEEMVKNWNSVVSKKDVVYHLGDFGDYNIIKRLNGKVYLICGNHEALKKGQNFEDFRQKLKDLGFADVYQEGLILDKKIFGQEIYMNHYPSKTKEGMVNFFGHVHTLKPLKRMGINVAANYHKNTPISKKDMEFFIKFVSDNTYSKEDFSE